MAATATMATMTTKPFRPIATCSPSADDDSFIYAIVPAANNGLAVISSADELVVLDRATVRQIVSLGSPQTPIGVTCLQPGGLEGNLVVCAGRDGSIVTFDVRSQERVANIKIDRAVTALACRDSELAVGTELAHQQAIVSLWDRRQNAMIWQSTENSDDLTDLQFHPSRRNHLLSGGIDGLVSIFDTHVADEDDSLLQVVNHGPIHKAGFLSDELIYALSHDEQFSTHSVTIDARDTTVPVVESLADAVADDIPPVHFGDLRPALQCDYAIDVVQSSGQSYIAAGTHLSEPHVDLVPLLPSARPQLRCDEAVRLMGAHGEDIVRAVYVDDVSEVIYTAGEDGRVTAFRADHEPQAPTSATKHVKKSSKNTNSIRFRPY